MSTQQNLLESTDLGTHRLPSTCFCLIFLIKIVKRAFQWQAIWWYDWDLIHGTRDCGVKRVFFFVSWDASSNSEHPQIGSLAGFFTLHFFLAPEDAQGANYLQEGLRHVPTLWPTVRGRGWQAAKFGQIVPKIIKRPWEIHHQLCGEIFVIIQLLNID